MVIGSVVRNIEEVAHCFLMKPQVSKSAGSLITEIHPSYYLLLTSYRARLTIFALQKIKKKMIQRIQTVLLLGVAICMGLVLAYPIWFEENPDQTQGIIMTAFNTEVVDFGGTLDRGDDDTIVESNANWHIASLAIIASLVALFSIFQFKSRLNQMKLGALNALIMAATLGLSYYQVFQLESSFSPETQGSISLGFYLPAFAMLLNILANRFIRKDEKLVKSADRMR